MPTVNHIKRCFLSILLLTGIFSANTTHARELVILIPGIELPEKFHQPLQPLLAKLGIDTRNQKAFNSLKNYLTQSQRDIMIYNWGYGWRWNKDIKPAAERLTALLSRHKNRPIKIIAKSMGSVITDLACQQINPFTIQRLVKIAAPELDTKLKSKCKIKQAFHIYSNDDYFLQAAAWLSPQLKKWQAPTGKNAIPLHQLTHSQFNMDTKILSSHKQAANARSTFELYQQLLN